MISALGNVLKGRLPSAWEAALKRAAGRRRDKARATRFRRTHPIGAMESPPCSLCGGRDVRFHLQFNGFRIVRCNRDGLIFVSPRPTDVAPFYDRKYYTGEEHGLYGDYAVHARDMGPEWRSRLSRIESIVAGKGLLLDVGAATGDFLLLARDRGWRVLGIEKSDWASERARENYGVEVIAGDLPAAPIQPESVDVVTMWDCIEHLSEPAETVAAAARILKKGGMMAISTGAVPDRDPRLESGWYFPPWHLYYFSPETIRALCEQSGFRIIDLEVSDPDTAYPVMTLFARTAEG